MSKAEWLIMRDRFLEFSADERRDKEAIAMLAEWINENKPRTKIISLDEYRERRSA